MASPTQGMSAASDVTVHMELLLQKRKANLTAHVRARARQATTAAPALERRQAETDIARWKQSIAAITGSIYQFADTYTLAWNVGFAPRLLQDLPQELRDQVYKELAVLDDEKLAGTQEIKVRDWQSKHWSGGSFLPPKVTGYNFPHWYNQVYMGNELIAEFIKIVYRERTFQLEHQDEIQWFLQEDVFGTGCIPAQHVQHLNIKLSIDYYRDNAQIVRWSHPRLEEPVRKHCNRAVAVFKSGPHKALNPGSNATITFTVPEKHRKRAVKLAEVMGSHVWDMKEAGWEVSVGPVSVNGLCEVYYDYGTSRAEWKKKIRKNSVFAFEKIESITKRKW